MSELSSMTGKDLPEEQNVTAETPSPKVESAVPYAIPIDELAKATGHEIPHDETPREVQDTLQEKPPVADYSTLPPVDQIKPQIKRVHTPGQPEDTPSGAQSPQEVEQYEQVLDATEMGFAQEQQKFQQRQADKKNQMNTMFEQLQKEEEERLARMRAIEEEDRAAGVNVTQVTPDARQREARQSDNPEVSPYELTPGYSDDDPDETKDDSVSDQNEGKLDKDTPPDPGSEEYREYVRNLPVTDVEDDIESPLILIREPGVSVIKKSGKNQVIGDQAFMNAITNFKKTTFGKMTVPMVNSGFRVDVVGTGVVDMQNLYMNISEGTSRYDYDIEKMKILIRNVVGTYPKIHSMDLGSMLHYRDYEMLSFAHVCATLKKVETLTNCTSCGQAFRMETDPTKLLLNRKEIYDQAMKIDNAPNIEACSLMTHYHEVDTAVGIRITLGHPSYAEYIRCITGFQSKLQELTPADQRRFSSMLPILIYVRKAELPIGTKSNNIYQHYLALGMLSSTDFDLVTAEVDKMNSEIIEPKYGIKEVRCPICGAVVKDIPYENLLDLLFIHTTVSGILSNPKT